MLRAARSMVPTLWSSRTLQACILSFDALRGRPAPSLDQRVGHRGGGFVPAAGEEGVLDLHGGFP